MSGKDNERTLNYLPIQNISELSESGLYFAVMKRAGSFESEYETSFFFVSDIGLHTRAYKDQLVRAHGFAEERRAARAASRCPCWMRRGETVVAGETDANGNAQIAYALNAEQVLIARARNDVSLLPFNQPALDLSDFAVAGRKEAWFDVFGWSDRDLYRPGRNDSPVRAAARPRRQSDQAAAVVHYT